MRLSTNFARGNSRAGGFMKPWVAIAIAVSLVFLSGAFGVLFGILDRQPATPPPDPSTPPADATPVSAGPVGPSTPMLPPIHMAPSEAEMNALIEVVKAGRPADRITAAHLIEQHAKLAARAVPALLGALDDTNPELDAAILAALDKIGPPLKEYLPLLTSALSAKSLSARRYAAQSFAERLSAPEEAIPGLVALLNDTHAEIRTYAARSLQRVGEKAKPAALGPLVALAADLDPSVREAASKAIKAFGAPTFEDIPSLKPHLADKSPQVRSEAMSLLGSIVTNNEQAAKVYLPLLTDKNPEIRLIALKGLIAYKDTLPKVASSIYPLFKDVDKNVRSTALGAAALLQGDEKLSEELAAAFKTETDPNLHTQIADTYVRIAEPRPSDVKTLRAVLSDCPLKVRRAALDKLAMLKKDAAPAVNDIINLINDPSMEVHKTLLLPALQALAAIAPDPKVTLPIASANFLDKTASNDVRVAAVDLLAACGPGGIKVLKDTTPYMLPDPVKSEMCNVFASLGDDAKDVYLWMIDTCETIDTCRVAVGDSLAKTGDDKLVKELLKRTDKYRAGVPGVAPVIHPLEYRTWALQTLGKMDLSKIKPDTREHLETKMKLITGDDEIDASLHRLAEAVLKKLKK